MTIVQFDPYVIETWLDHGVAIAVPEAIQEEQPPKPGRFARAFSVRSVVSASVVVVGMALTNLAFDSSGFGVSDVVRVTESAQYEAADDDVPSGRWMKLVALLRDSAQLPADDTRGDPDPLG
jgi:hypothetical protein